MSQTKRNAEFFKIAMFIVIMVIIVVGVILMYEDIIEDEVSNEATSGEVTIANPVYTTSSFESMFFITAAHLDIEVVEKATGYKYGFSEEGTDRAFYLKPDYSYRAVTLGTSVHVDNILDGEVTETSQGIFYITPDDTTKVYAGMSGMRVYDSNTEEEIGFVSELTEDLRIMCYTTY